MIDARGVLARVHDEAPTEDDRRRLDRAYARATGREPRTLTRAIDRAKSRTPPLVSAKVADSLHAFLYEHERCAGCGEWYAPDGRLPRCRRCRGGAS
jgi:hypothetical protein